jgi:hypothetical protein
MLETKATPSEPTNLLIDLATRLLEGEDVSRELDEKLSAQIALVESELEMVPVRAKERGETFIEENNEVYETLLSHMYLYHEGLMELAAFFDAEEPDGLFLEAGVNRLLEVTGDLVQVQTVYGQIFASHGQSRFPMVNALTHLFSEYRKNPDGVDEEVNLVLQMMQDQLLKDLESDLGDDEPGIEEARSGAQKAVEILEKLKKDYTDLSTHEAHIKALGEALFEMESGDEELKLSMLEGPSAMPAANLFINTARRAMDGKIPKEAIPSALAAYVEHVTDNWDTIEAQLEKPVDSAAIQEELPNTMELVDEHEEVVERLEAIYHEGLDRERFEEAISDLIEIVRNFKQSAQVFIDAAGRVGKVVCVSCGRGNPRANNVCEACGMALPKIVDDEHSTSTFELSERGGLEAGTEMVMTTNIARIFKAGEQMAEGEIDAATFQAELQWANGLLVEMEQGITKREAELAVLHQDREDEPEVMEEKQSLAEVLAFFEEGIDEWRAGLEEMARYIDEPEARHLKSGMKRVWEGASAIHRCKIIGDAAQERLDMMAEQQAEEAR